jgi:hypothetical protein
MNAKDVVNPPDIHQSDQFNKPSWHCKDTANNHSAR